MIFTAFGAARFGAQVISRQIRLPLMISQREIIGISTTVVRKQREELGILVGWLRWFVYSQRYIVVCTKILMSLRHHSNCVMCACGFQRSGSVVLYFNTDKVFSA